MQHSSTGNPDIIPEEEKKESARDHTERRSMWTPGSENKHTAYHSFRDSVDDLILTAAVILVFFPSTANIVDPLSDNLACRSTANLWLTWWQWPRLQPVNITLTRKRPFRWTHWSPGIKKRGRLTGLDGIWRISTRNSCCLYTFVMRRWSFRPRKTGWTDRRGLLRQHWSSSVES